MKFRFLPALALAWVTSASYALPVQAWARTANLANYDSPQAMAMDSLGNVIIVGSVNNVGGFPDIGLFKYSPAGALVWTRKYGQAGYDSVRKVAVAKDNSIIVVGTTQAANNSPTKGLLIKYSSAGVLAFARTHGGTDATGYNSYESVAVNAAGAITAVGYVTNSATGRDAVARQYSPAGAIGWTRLYSPGGNVENRFQHVQIDAAGDLFAAGYTSDAKAALLMKLIGTTGAPAWTKTYSQGTSTFTVQGLELDPTGNAALLLNEYNYPNPQKIVLMEFLRTTGAFSLSPRKILPPADRREYVTGFDVDATGAFLLAIDQSWNVGQTYNVLRRLVRMAPTGVTLWTRTLNAATETVEGGPMMLDAQNNVYIASNVVQQGTNVAKPKMWKYTSAGVLAWTFQPKRGGTQTDLINAMARKSTGEIYTAGYGKPSLAAQSSDIVIFKITGG